MSNFKKTMYQLLPAFLIIFNIVWLSVLSGTDSYFSIYVMLSFCSFFVIIQERLTLRALLRHSNDLLLTVLSCVFSCLVILANYSIFTQVRDTALVGYSTNILLNLINVVFAFLGGFSVAYPILSYVFNRFPVSRLTLARFSSRKIFFAAFISILIIDCIHLFFVEFPGNLSQDTFAQISEMVSGEYSNFNTVWHTWIVQSILSMGYFFFADVNSAVAVYSVFQIIVLAFSFAYCLMTMTDYGIPDWAVMISYIVFALIPYQIALSITIWKDVLFAAGTLIFLCAWLRIKVKLNGNILLDYCCFVIGSLLFFLSRSNGWILYITSVLVYLLFVRKNKQLISIMAGLAILGWFLLNPALDMLNISGSDPVESLSIPIQQVSRVIAEGGELTAEEQELISMVVDIEQVPDLYCSWLSDPMKVAIRNKNHDYFCDNLQKYGKLWVNLGLRYPGEYVKAWIDQTRGYWNGGYDVALYSENITDNDYGIEKSGFGNVIASLFRLYFGLSRHLIFFEPLHSIGFHVWITVLCFVLNFVKKREVWFLAVPPLLLVLGLSVAAPVYCCFRYVYPLFVSFPLIVSTAVFERKHR